MKPPTSFYFIPSEATRLNLFCLMASTRPMAYEVLLRPVQPRIKYPPPLYHRPLLISLAFIMLVLSEGFKAKTPTGYSALQGSTTEGALSFSLYIVSSTVSLFWNLVENIDDKPFYFNSAHLLNSF